MAKPTHIEKLGFADPDFKSPKHDEIMRWLDLNAETIVKLITDKHREHIPLFKDDLTNRIRRFIDQQLNHLQSEDDSHANPPGISNSDLIEWWKNWPGEPGDPCYILLGLKTWEYVVSREGYKGGAGFDIGFIDLHVKWAVSEDFLDRTLLQNCRLEFERGVSYPRLTAHRSFTPMQPLAFEVKATIDSLGALIRQIRLYEKHCSCTHFVVSSDATVAPLLCSQRIGFVTYPEAEVFLPEGFQFEQ